MKKQETPTCCNLPMLFDGEAFDPSRGKMTFWKCSKCGGHQMIFNSLKRDQSRAYCGECEHFYRRGCFADFAKSELACKDFEEMK
jgi:hypothetical protein